MKMLIKLTQKATRLIAEVMLLRDKDFSGGE